MKKLLIAAVMAGIVGAGVATAGPASATCQWDAAWFFGLGCNPVQPPPPPPPPPGPETPPPPA